MTTALDDKITDAFIEENAQWFTFLRRERIETNEGGTILGPPTPVLRSILETFNNPDGTDIGPNLNWAQRVFYEEDFPVVIQNGRLKYTLAFPSAGARERILAPVPSFRVRDVVVEYDVPEISKIGDPNYWNGLGAILRGQIDAHSWSGVGFDFGANDQLISPIETASLIIWKVEFGGDPARNVVNVIGQAAAPLAGFTFPAKVTLEAQGSTFRGVAVGANGVRLEAVGNTTDYPEGEVTIGIGPVINGNTTVSMSMDNFAAHSPDQRGRLVQSGRVGASGLRHNPDGRVRDTTATIVMRVGSDVQVGDLVEVTPAHVGGDPTLVGQWEVVDISGRWAMNVEIMKHAG